MHNEKVFFQKTDCLTKAIKKCFLKKTECLASTYKSGGLNDKLPKMTIYINEFISYLNKYCEIIFFLTNIS